MAIKLGGNNSSDLVENSEINVTPFIDVMLVLLIIFMVAAPLATVSVKVNLPASSAKPEVQPDKPIYLSIKEDDSLYLGEDSVELEQIGTTLDALTNADRQKAVFVRGDENVEYRRLMQVMDSLRSAGYLRVGLVGLETVAQ